MNFWWIILVMKILIINLMKEVLSMNEYDEVEWIKNEL